MKTASAFACDSTMPMIAFFMSTSDTKPELRLATRVDAPRTRAEVREEERRAEHRYVLHEHRLLDLRGHRIGNGPELVHHQRDRNEKDHEQHGADARLVSERDAQRADERDDAGRGDEDAR